MNSSFIVKKFVLFCVFIGLPLVNIYHSITGSVFFNMEIEGAKGLEKFANHLLVPSRYLFAGQKVAIKNRDGKQICEIKQHYNYEIRFGARTIASLCAFPIATPLGLTLKALSFIDSRSLNRHKIARSCLNSFHVNSNIAYYQSIGIDTSHYLEGETSECQHHKRRPGDSDLMKADQIALKKIMQVLNKHNLIFWLDTGTCLGAYRYGGVIPWDFDVDIAILEPDFRNVKNALNELDKSKYVVQDWSGRDFPETYLKVYVKESHSLIDIYHFKIHPKDQTLTSIVSNEKSIILSEKWKWRERRYKVPTPISYVFPLKKGEFDGLQVPIPNQTVKYLQLRYGDNLDPNCIYNELTRDYEKDESHPYWALEYAH
ncbi:MAG: LicD family protein [Rhabdochlamydiaceae bacterium]|nr:LicD family protein [Candidatus Amphrikana amoebophyrae]